MTNHQQSAENEVFRSEGIRRWISARIEQIHSNITAHDVLRRNGVNLKQGASDREEQFPCPFHGHDNKPSARVYSSSNRGPSHVWCFTCHERWDAIALWKKFSGTESKFTYLLTQIERDFGLPTPEAPPMEDEPDDAEAVELELLFGVCERRLKAAKSAFDMKAFLTVGSVLDRLFSGVENGTVNYETAKAALRRVLDKIGEKERACPGG
jgi:hypothetical protein